MNLFSAVLKFSTTFVIIAITGSVAVQAGSMRGQSGHKASGSAKVSGNTVKLGSNFRFDGGPNVYVAVKKRGQKMKLISKLRKNNGAQSYKLPIGSKKANVDQILLWCKTYNVPLGTANAN